MTTPAFREAEPDDVPALTDLINEAYKPAEGFLYDGPRITAAEVREKMARGRFLLAEGTEEGLEGCVYVEVTGESGYFGLLAVSPRLQRRGLGRDLATAAEAACRDAGLPTVTIDVVNHRHELFRFYARLGYEIVGERRFDDERLNRPAHFVVMRKALAALPPRP